MGGRFVAGLQHVFQSWRKPFNPILGETWQVRAHHTLCVTARRLQCRGVQPAKPLDNGSAGAVLLASVC